MMLETRVAPSEVLLFLSGSILAVSLTFFCYIVTQALLVHIVTSEKFKT